MYFIEERPLAVFKVEVNLKCILKKLFEKEILVLSCLSVLNGSA
jgi:hypothetical protein